MSKGQDDKDKDVIDQRILDLTDQRGAGSSICPSEVARSLYPENWRTYMDRVRQRAYVLHEAGDIMVTQKGSPVDPEKVKGPIRLKKIK